MSKQGLSQEERLHCMHLARCSGVGPSTFRRLIDSFGSATAALRGLPELIERNAKGLRQKIMIPPRQAIEQEYAAIDALGGHVLVLSDDDYPPSLAVLGDAPLALTVLGQLRFFKKDMLSIVGSRRAAGSSILYIRSLAADLASCGYVVVSGLAHGIDAAAHEGSLASGTVAVLAGGVDQIYPPEKKDLYHAIADKGVLLSEEPLGKAPKGGLFPKRNRIIAGLSLGTIVIDAEKNSGSLITAQRAVDYGRDVFAIPGAPQDPRSWGANHLIRDGATLVTRVEDILDVLAAYKESLEEKKPHVQPAKPTMNVSLGDKDIADIRASVMTLLSPSALDVDELARLCDFPWSSIAYVLLQLELEGRIEYHIGNRVSLLK